MRFPSPGLTILWALLLAGGCGTTRGAGAPPVDPATDGAAPAGGPALEAGDVVVAFSEGERPGVRRYRTRLDASERLRVQARTLLSTDLHVASLAVAGAGRWLAAELVDQEGSSEVRLWDLSGGELHGADQPLWVSPPGCTAPSMHPVGQLLVLGCPREGRRPASVLELRLPSLAARVLLGETDRLRPVVGAEGDLYWLEEEGAVTRVFRMSEDRLPYVVHEVVGGLEKLWPQHDGSLFAERRSPTSDRELLRLSAAGEARALPLPSDSVRRPGQMDALVANPDGAFLFASCDPEPCAVLRVGAAGAAGAPLTVAERISAIAEVPARAAQVKHREDLCTAPASVLRTHTADQVGVLGVELETPLETAFSLLERGGRHPYWILRGEERRRVGIGLGSVPTGHCIEYQADESGLVGAIELQGCAVPYVSPALQPLLTVDRYPEGALPVARDFLGPGVAGSVGDGRVEGPAAEAAERLPIEGRRVRYEAVDRGYWFEARTEMLNTGRIRFLDGRVLLRLHRPGERLTAGRN